MYFENRMHALCNAICYHSFYQQAKNGYTENPNFPKVEGKHCDTG